MLPFRATRNSRAPAIPFVHDAIATFRFKGRRFNSSAATRRYPSLSPLQLGAMTTLSPQRQTGFFGEPPSTWRFVMVPLGWRWRRLRVSSAQ